MIVRRFSCVFLFCFCMHGYMLQAQQNKVDSLRKVLLIVKEDTAKVNVLNALAMELRNSDPDTSIYYSKAALKLSEKIDFKIGIGEAQVWYAIALSNLGEYDEALRQCYKANALFQQLLSILETEKVKKLFARSLNTIGNVYSSRGNYPASLKNHFAALEIRKEIKDLDGQANSYNNIGGVYVLQGKYPDALKSYFAGLEIKRKLGDKSGVATIYGNIGMVYSHHGNYSEALRNYLAALKIQKMINDKVGESNAYLNIGNVFNNQGNCPEALRNFLEALKIKTDLGNKAGIASCYIGIGNVYLQQENYPESLKNYFKSLKLKEELGDKNGIALALSNIGLIYTDQLNYSEALKSHLASLKIRKEIGDKMGIINSYNNIGEVCVRQGNYEEAKKNHLLALEISKEIEFKLGIAWSYGDIGLVYQKQGNVAKAIDYAKKALTSSEEIGAITVIRDMSNSLFESYKATGNYKEALEMHELFVQLRDSVINEKNQKEIMGQQFKYDYDKKALSDSLNFVNQKNINDLKNEAEHKSERVKRYTLYAGLSLIIIFSLFIFNRFRITSDQKRIIEHQNFQIVESINYSKKIQQSLLPSVNVMQKSLHNLFIFFEPKDIVSGDFYWYKEFGKYAVLACVDCTGHGVPGGFMSTLGSLLLDRVVNEESFGPSEILSNLNVEIINVLNQQSGGEIQDGMDLSVCVIDFANRTIEFSGARNGIVIVTNGQAKQYKADLYPVGGNYSKKGKPVERKFQTQKISIEKNDWVYMYTDGFMEQTGEKGSLPMNYSQFENYLIEISNNLTPEEKTLQLQWKLNSWRGEQERNDDILIMGFQIS